MAAEFVGVFASAVAIVQIAGAAAKLSVSLYRTARCAGSARDEIEAFASDIGSFASVIEVAHGTLVEHCSKDSNSAVLRHVQDHNVLEQLTEQSLRIKKHIEIVRPKVRDLRSKISILNRFMWVWKRDQVKALHPQMDTVRSNLQLLLHIVSFEVLLQRKSPDDQTRLEIKRLRRQIEVQVRTIRMLRNREERVNSNINDDQHDVLPNLGGAGQNSLIELAESMVNTGRVPEPDDASTNHGSYSSSIWDPRVEPPDGRNLAEGPPFYLQNSSDTTQATETLPDFHTSNSGQPGDTVLPQATSVEVEGQHSATTVSQIPDDSGDDDYVAVSPTENILYLNADRRVQGESGCVQAYRPLRKVVVEAIVDEELQDNVVSQGFVVQHGLEPEEIEDEDGITVEFEPGVRLRSSEVVVLEWSKDNSHRRPFGVRCWVFPYNGRPIYFGKRYLEKRDHYWGKKSG